MLEGDVGHVPDRRTRFRRSSPAIAAVTIDSLVVVDALTCRLECGRLDDGLVARHETACAARQGSLGTGRSRRDRSPAGKRQPHSPRTAIFVLASRNAALGAFVVGDTPQPRRSRRPARDSTLTRNGVLRTAEELIEAGRAHGPDLIGAAEIAVTVEGAVHVADEVLEAMVEARPRLAGQYLPRWPAVGVSMRSAQVPSSGCRAGEGCTRKHPRPLRTAVDDGSLRHAGRVCRVGGACRVLTSVGSRRLLRLTVPTPGPRRVRSWL